MLAIPFLEQDAQLKQAQLRDSVVSASIAPITITFEGKRVQILVRAFAHRPAELRDVHVRQEVSLQVQRLQLPELELVLDRVVQKRLQRLAVDAVVWQIRHASNPYDCSRDSRDCCGSSGS